jgi:hypothetical protein
MVKKTRGEAMLDKQKFIEIMSGLCELFNKQPSEFIFDTYYEIFKNYSLERVNGAVMACVKSYKYNTLPKPAEILQFLEDSKEDKALRAWVYVLEAVKKAGYYNTVEFKDKNIHHCISELGGWMWFCSQERDQLPFIEKRFLDLYRIFSKRELIDSPRLFGFYEVVNIEKGQDKEIPKPILIGFEEETLQLTKV